MRAMIRSTFFLLLVLCLGVTGFARAGEEAWKNLLPLDDLAAAAKENPRAQLYRLTVERSFDPVVVLELSCGEDGTLRVRRTDRRVNHDDGTVRYTRLTEDSSIKVSPQQTASFLDLIAASDFWKAPADDWREPGLDGSTWTLEGVRDGQYHKVTRSSPFAAASLSATAQTLEKLGPGRCHAEGLLGAVFAYVWALAGSSGDPMY